jgi:hypothetical protein
VAEEIKFETKRATSDYQDRYISRDEALLLPLDEKAVKLILKRVPTIHQAGEKEYISLAQFQYHFAKQYGCTITFDNNYIPLKERKDPLVNILYGNASSSLKNIALCTIAAFPDLRMSSMEYTLKLIMILLVEKNKLKKSNILNRAVSRDWHVWVKNILQILVEEKKIKKARIGSFYHYTLQTEDVSAPINLLKIFNVLKSFPITTRDKAVVDYIVYANGYPISNESFVVMKDWYPKGPTYKDLHKFVSQNYAKRVIRYIEDHTLESAKIDVPFFAKNKEL